MKISRRTFLKDAAAVASAASAAALVGCGQETSASSANPTSKPTLKPTPEPTPSPTPEPIYNADVLTGEERALDAENSRIIGVMINNIANTSYQNARPQRGLSSAKMLMEIMVEGGITRFCAVFSEASSIPEIGPIRSGRDQFLQLLMPWQGIYCHEGESVFCTRFIKDWEYWIYNIGGKNWFDTPTNSLPGHRDKRGMNVASEHTLFTSGEEIQKAIDKANGGDGIDMYREYNSKFFVFTDYRYNEFNELPGCDEALSITLRHSASYRTYFTWDAASGTYLMSQYSAATGAVSPTVDQLNGEQLAFTNVLAMFTTIEAYPGDSHDIQSVDFDYGGVGYYFSNGKAKLVHWTKGSPANPLLLIDPTDPEGGYLKVNVGKCYLTFVDLEQYDHFHFEGSEIDDDLSDTEDMTDVTDNADGEAE